MESSGVISRWRCANLFLKLDKFAPCHPYRLRLWCYGCYSRSCHFAIREQTVAGQFRKRTLYGPHAGRDVMSLAEHFIPWRPLAMRQEGLDSEKNREQFTADANL